MKVLGRPNLYKGQTVYRVKVDMNTTEVTVEQGKVHSVESSGRSYRCAYIHFHPDSSELSYGPEEFFMRPNLNDHNLKATMFSVTPDVSAVVSLMVDAVHKELNKQREIAATLSKNIEKVIDNANTATQGFETRNKAYISKVFEDCKRRAWSRI